MNQALILNAMIVVVILSGLALTANPLCILGLLMMNGLPFGLLAGRQEHDEEDEEQRAADGLHGTNPVTQHLSKFLLPAPFVGHFFCACRK